MGSARRSVHQSTEKYNDCKEMRRVVTIDRIYEKDQVHCPSNHGWPVRCENKNNIPLLDPEIGIAEARFI